MQIRARKCWCATRPSFPTTYAKGPFIGRRARVEDPREQLVKQVVQDLKNGSILLLEDPVPSPPPGHLLIRSRASLISSGTEKMLLDFGRSNLLQKALSQPERVKQVIQKSLSDGLAPTLQAVRARMDCPFPLGYCNA